MFPVCVPWHEKRIFYWKWNDTFTAAHTVFTSDPVDYITSLEADSRSAVYNFFTFYAIVSFHVLSCLNLILILTRGLFNWRSILILAPHVRVGIARGLFLCFLTLLVFVGILVCVIETDREVPGSDVASFPLELDCTKPDDSSVAERSFCMHSVLHLPPVAR
jgi:hypothetical protein